MLCRLGLAGLWPDGRILGPLHDRRNQHDPLKRGPDQAIVTPVLFGRGETPDGTRAGRIRTLATGTPIRLQLKRKLLELTVTTPLALVLR
jgi:hypothetical protein